MKQKKLFLLFMQSKRAGNLKDAKCIKKFTVIPPLK